MNPIHTPSAPEPAGHYAQAIVHNGLVYVSGQLPIDPVDPTRAPGSIEEQTERALRNVEAILIAAGTRLDRVLQMTVYISDIGKWSAVNEVHARVLGDHRPARAVVPTRELHHGYEVEIQTIAAVHPARPPADAPGPQLDAGEGDRGAHTGGAPVTHRPSSE